MAVAGSAGRSTGGRGAGGGPPGRRGGQLEGSFVQLRWRTAVPLAAGSPEPTLTMAVAKKLLPRAIDRNRFRRIVREAWWAGVKVHPPVKESLRRSQPATVVDGDDVSVSVAVPHTEQRTGRSVFLRLMKTQPDWKTMPDGPLKRRWREELDRLLGELDQRLRAERR